jgi:membrane protein required for colicin V production
MAQQTLHIILFITIFVITVIIAHFLGKGIESIIKLTMMGWLNRILGFLFGAMKAIIILSVAVCAINWINGTFDIIPKDFLAESRGYGFLADFAKEFFPFLQKYFS